MTEPKDGFANASHPAVARRMEEHRARSAKYGEELVSRSRVVRAFSDLAGAELTAAGFEARKDSSLTCLVNDDVRQLVDVMAFKGQQFGLKWGVSLGFLPHAWKDGLKWHRTASSARFDLFRFDVTIGEASADEWGTCIDGLHGEGAAREDLVRIWSASRSGIMAWLETVTTVEAVLEEANLQRASGYGKHHAPDPDLVRVFALARTGRSEAARLAFDELSKNDPEGLYSPLASVLDTATGLRF